MKNALTTMKKDILTMSYRAKEGHIASAYSILDILYVLYEKILFDANGEKLGEFILSKGHASLALYAVLRGKGMVTSEEFDSFATYDSILGGHPSRNKVNGVVASTGSLGKRIQGKGERTYVLVGDGELNEGSVWEAIELAGHHRLDALTCIVDYNHSTDRALDLGRIGDKFAVFGWEAVTIDGHDHAALEAALTARSSEGKPRAIIAETIKGYGCKDMENNPAWHHRFPTAEEMEQMLAELDERNG